MRSGKTRNRSRVSFLRPDEADLITARAVLIRLDWKWAEDTRIREGDTIVSARTIHLLKSDRYSNKNNNFVSFGPLTEGIFVFMQCTNFSQLQWTKLQLSRILAINYLLTLPTIAQMQRVLVSFDQG